MIKRSISCILALVFVLGSTTLSTTAPDAARDAIAKAAETFEAAKPIRQKLDEFIAYEVSESVSDEAEYSSEEAETALRDLVGYNEQIGVLLASLNGLPDSPDTSDGKTIRATREYLTMLSNMSGDLTELISYSIDLEKAIRLMDSMYEDSGTYQEYAELIWDATNDTIAAMNMIKPPVYLTITHNDMLLRIKEFNDFAKDFYQAAELGDPLRINSCIFRLDRINRMFTVCGENLDADMNLQVRQAERRLSGPIALLYGELERNLAILINA